LFTKQPMKRKCQGIKSVQNRYKGGFRDFFENTLFQNRTLFPYDFKTKNPQTFRNGDL
jgi:hypothetical protein